MTCRVCLDECEEKLMCKCAGFAHIECIRNWVRARINRGDRYDDVFYCEVCRVPYLPEPRCACSWLHFRILAMRLIMLAAVLTGGANVIIIILPDVWGVMIGLLMITMFIILYVSLRVLDRHCINACLCSDVVYLEV